MDIRGKYPLITSLRSSLRHFFAKKQTEVVSPYILGDANDPSMLRETDPNRIKDQSLPHSLFLPSSLPPSVSGTLCSRLAANLPSANPTTDPSGRAGGSPLEATLIKVVFAEGTLLMGLGSSSPVVDEITLHAPN